ncbi:MAG: hypothetical protein AB7H93_25465 [Vicinamibacterales bacterium]
MADPMVDPFDALRRPPGRTEPAAAFREQLLARCRAELDAMQHQAPTVLPLPAAAGAGADRPVRAEQPALTIVSSVSRPRRVLAVAIGAAAAVLVAVVAMAVRDGRERAALVDRPASSTLGASVSTTTVGANPTTTSGPLPAGPALPAIRPLEDLDATALLAVPRGTEIVSGGGTLLTARGNVVEQRDPDSGAVRTSATLPVAWDVGMLQLDGDVWAAASGTGPAVNGLPGLLYRIDATTGAVGDAIEVPGGLRPFSGLVPDGSGHGFWLLTMGAPARLVHVATDPGVVDLEIPAPEGTTAIGVGHGSLWAARVGGALSRLDPTDGRELAEVSLPMAEGWVVRADGEAIWVFGYDSGQRPLVAKVEPGSNTLVATVVVGGPLDLLRFYGFEVANGSVWVHPHDAELVQVDAATATVVARYGSTTGGGSVVATDEALWVGTAASNALYRIPWR